jgi:hypothetical protein
MQLIPHAPLFSQIDKQKLRPMKTFVKRLRSAARVLVITSAMFAWVKFVQDETSKNQTVSGLLDVIISLALLLGVLLAAIQNLFNAHYETEKSSLETSVVTNERDWIGALVRDLEDHYHSIFGRAYSSVPRVEHVVKTLIKRRWLKEEQHVKKYGHELGNEVTLQFRKPDWYPAVDVIGWDGLSSNHQSALYLADNLLSVTSAAKHYYEHTSRKLLQFSALSFCCAVFISLGFSADLITKSKYVLFVLLIPISVDAIFARGTHRDFAELHEKTLRLLADSFGPSLESNRVKLLWSAYHGHRQCYNGVPDKFYTGNSGQIGRKAEEGAEELGLVAKANGS